MARVGVVDLGNSPTCCFAESLLVGVNVVDCCPMCLPQGSLPYMKVRRVQIVMMSFAKFFVPYSTSIGRVNEGQAGT
jgi:hypothetical protein